MVTSHPGAVVWINPFGLDSSRRSIRRLLFGRPGRGGRLTEERQTVPCVWVHPDEER